MRLNKAIGVLICIAVAIIAGLLIYATHELHRNNNQFSLASGEQPAAENPAIEPTHADTPAEAVAGSPPSSVTASKPLSARRASVNDPQDVAQAASMVKLWEPQTPADVVRGFVGADKSLVACLKAWQEQLATGTPGGPQALPQLEQALEKSTLTPEQCVQMTRLLSRWEEMGDDERDACYEPFSGAFASQAIFAAAITIKIDSENRQPVMATIAPLIRRLWHGNGLHLKAVEQFYSILADYEPKGSAEWLRGRTGCIEAMSMQLHCDQAIASVEALEKDLPSMTEEQQAAVSYSKGMTLFGADRFAEAVPALRVTAHDPANGNCADAQALLVIALARTNNVADARTECALMDQSPHHGVLFTSALIALHAAERSADAGRQDHQ